MSANKIIFNDSINIGQNGAELDDKFLFKCFVDHPAYSEITEMNSPKTFLLGSTGAGKTAILRMIKKQEKNVADLAVHDMAMNHIANSDTILFLTSLGIDLSLFFQALWKHVFCIEYIKLATRARDKDQFHYKITRLIETLTRGRAREKLESFVSNHADQFWNTIDENVIELTDSLENECNASLGGELKKFVAKAGYVHTMGSQQKIQLQQRARKFLSQATLSEIPAVISALSDYTRDRQDKYFITVDGLDEHWVDEDIKFQLIQAMFESLKNLKKLRNFQVVVALRNDLYVRMVQETPSTRQQIEKYDDLIIRLKWSEPQLKELAEKRIGEMCRRQYSSENVGFTDVFKQNPNTKSNAWDYLYERTLRRPRDVINFINLAMQAADNKSAVSKNNFLKGEANYSNLRHETLIHEWSGTFPGIAILLEQLRGLPAYRSASELAHSRFIDELYDAFGQDARLHSDEIWLRLVNYVDESIHLEPIELCQMVLYRLHLVGAIGLKLREDRPWDWMFDTNNPVADRQIDQTTKFRVHPMLFAALSIRK